MFFGVLGNVTVIIYTIFFNKEKTATSYLVGNLALADLLECLTFYPVWIIEFIQTILSIENDQNLFCKFSRSTVWAFMFASIATLLGITVDRYVYIVNPLRYLLIVTHQRVFRAVAGIWFIAWCILIVHCIYDKSYSIAFRSLCYIPSRIYYFTIIFAGYIPLILILILNLHILSVSRKQRKRILAETKISSFSKSAEKPVNRLNFVLGFFVALKAAKTFAIVVAVLTFCILTPTVVGPKLREFCSKPCKQIWYVVVHYELNGINSVVNVFIYGIRHVKYRKAYLHIFFKLFSCHKATN